MLLAGHKAIVRPPVQRRIKKEVRSVGVEVRGWLCSKLPSATF
jgi:hypothetical protein